MKRKMCRLVIIDSVLGLRRFRDGYLKCTGESEYMYDKVIYSVKRF